MDETTTTVNADRDVRRGSGQPGDSNGWPEPEVLAMYGDSKIETLNHVLLELEACLQPVRLIRDEVIDEDLDGKVTAPLGLYIRHVERVIQRGRWLLVHGAKNTQED